MRAAFENDVLMDLVRDDEHAVPAHEIKKLLELFARPHSADGVVRRAENKRLDVMRTQRFLKRGKVDGVCPVLRGKVTADKLSLVVLHCVHERIVDRREHENLVARRCHRLQKPVDRRHNARCDAQPLALDAVAVHVLFPLHEGLEVGVRHLIIAEDALLQIGLQRVSDALWGLKVHVRHPHCLKVCGAELCQKAVPLAAIRVSAVYKAESLSAAVDTHMIAPFL